MADLGEGAGDASGKGESVEKKSYFNIRGLIAVISLFSFFGVSIAIMFGIPLMGIGSVEQSLVVLKEWASVTSGIVGVIIGYYFTRKDN